MANNLTSSPAHEAFTAQCMCTYNRVQEQIGSGQFGRVYKGVWQSPGGGEVEVAVKTLKEGSGEEDRVKFLQEAAIMGQFKHPNVVEMHGLITIGEPVSDDYYPSYILLLVCRFLLSRSY